MKREKLFSVTLDDCDVETFTVGGHGGAGKDTSNTGVRIRHRASGAVGVGRDERSQLQNKRAAFRRMANTKEFRTWVKIKASGLKTIDQLVEEAMDEKFIKTEVLTKDGKWIEEIE